MTFENDEAGKIFVGGLNWQTTQENLETYFRQYGEIVDSVVMKHNETGKSRGFGFITYKDPAVVTIVLEAGPHVLDGKTIDPKACTKRNERRERGGVNSDSLKAFLGGLPLDITEDELTQAFQKFGEVKDIVIMYDQEKQKPRGFGFLTFDSQDALQRACREHFIVINGKQVECKAAQPRNARPRPRQPYGGPPQGGGGGMAQGGSNWQHSGGQPQAGGYGGNNSAPGGGYSAGYNAYQQQQPPPPSYNYQQGGNYGGGYQQNYNTPQAGYAAPPAAGYSAPAQPPAANQQYGQYGYGNDGGYDQSESQYGPAKGRQSGDNGYGGNAGYNKSEGGYGSHGSGQAYHPYK